MSVTSSFLSEAEVAADAPRAGGWGQVVDRWRCGRRVVVRERPAMVVSWVLAVTGSCVVVGVMGLTRPVERVAVERSEAGVGGVAEEWTMLEAAGEEAGLGEESGAEEAVPETLEINDFPEPAVAMTADDVFQIPAPVPVEPVAREQPVEREPSPPRPSVRSMAARKPTGAVAGPGAGPATGRSTGTAAGSGTGGGGGTAAAGRGRGAGYFPTPPYPAQARSRGQQGTVQLTIVFGNDGRVTSAAVGRGSGYSELDRTAAAWVRRHWRAAAGQVGTFRLPVHFKLR